MITKEEQYNPSVPNHTLYLKRVDGDYIALVQNKINETEGMMVIATTIEPVRCVEDASTNGKFHCWIYYKKRKTVKLQIDEVFIGKEKAKSLI